MITALFGWVPALFLLPFAAIGALLGLVAAIEGDIVFGIQYMLTGTGGILGFIAMTSLVWPRKPSFYSRLFMLLAGLLSLATVAYIGQSQSHPWFRITPHFIDIYLFYSPLLVGVIQLVMALYTRHSDAV
ncbi:hypothetical protein BFC17_14370 [Alteromonas lipolytica]|uniref:Uncharacterized protein n=2 Tax=Alteromonas lipolytica TaxID=1856405 RepID=A0A1E8FFR2_9ALTE|nr:hypothetical protein BFC17_14370 [Alteromonas lipolytica]